MTTAEEVNLIKLEILKPTRANPTTTTILLIVVVVIFESEKKSSVYVFENPLDDVLVKL